MSAAMSAITAFGHGTLAPNAGQKALSRRVASPAAPSLPPLPPPTITSETRISARVTADTLHARASCKTGLGARLLLSPPFSVSAHCVIRKPDANLSASRLRGAEVTGAPSNPLRSFSPDTFCRRRNFWLAGIFGGAREFHSQTILGTPNNSTFMSAAVG